MACPASPARMQSRGFRLQRMVDAGALLGYTPNKIDADVGHEHWHTTFGNVREELPGTVPNALFTEAGYHF